jgi:hypothetical protein
VPALVVSAETMHVIFEAKACRVFPRLDGRLKGEASEAPAPTDGQPGPHADFIRLTWPAPALRFIAEEVGADRIAGAESWPD